MSERGGRVEEGGGRGSKREGGSRNGRVAPERVEGRSPGGRVKS